MSNELELLTPENYFEYVKNKKHEMTSENLNEFYKNTVYLLEKYKKTNQIAAMKKLMFIVNSIEKEKVAIHKGINQYVYLEDIEEFISQVSSKVVKIIDLENYPREIPDDIIEKYENVKDCFDKFYVVFTDYTGEIEKKVEKERRDKDPILFGTFIDKDRKELAERFYYIGDWIDEYCDLTLEKMVLEMRDYNGKEIVNESNIPFNLDELRLELDSYTYQRGEYVKIDHVPNKNNTKVTKKEGGIFQKVLGWFK